MGSHAVTRSAPATSSSLPSSPAPRTSAIPAGCGTATPPTMQACLLTPVHGSRSRGATEERQAGFLRLLDDGMKDPPARSGAAFPAPALRCVRRHREAAKRRGLGPPVPGPVSVHAHTGTEERRPQPAAGGPPQQRRGRVRRHRAAARRPGSGPPGPGPVSVRPRTGTEEHRTQPAAGEPPQQRRGRVCLRDVHNMRDAYDAALRVVAPDLSLSC
ncbi:hypothetical protein GGX14DRAFT_560769 [Mycena pura]|uniref:Uncharacterized protein n=1 Tax=Mycena pura TaxID=153505 RepID=A0AAD6YHX4_9AGAR|nr:hypothetical protein GGX14DRAFT_560769 [Mycena pura]